MDVRQHTLLKIQSCNTLVPGSCCSQPLKTVLLFIRNGVLQVNRGYALPVVIKCYIVHSAVMHFKNSLQE